MVFHALNGLAGRLLGGEHGDVDVLVGENTRHCGRRELCGGGDVV